jgi:hypothetical protein
MKVIKGFFLTLLSLLLFLSLIVFGFAYTVDRTVLNPKFISAQLERLDMSAVVQEIITGEMAEAELPEELMNAVIDTIDRLEAPIKEETSAAIRDIYDYPLGKRENPDLKATLRNTFLNADFVASLMAELDLAKLADEVISQQFSGEGVEEELSNAMVKAISRNEATIKQKIPLAFDDIFRYLLGETESLDLAHILRSSIITSELVQYFLDEIDIGALSSKSFGEELEEQLPEELRYLSEYLDEAVAEIEPLIKEEISRAYDPVLDYLFGERQGVGIEISLDSVVDSLEDSLRKAFLKSPPPEYAGLPAGELNRLFDQYFEELTSNIPSTIALDEALSESGLPEQIADALAQIEDGFELARESIAEAIADAESQLEMAREYVRQFQMYYYILIAWLVFLILAIIGINHEVKGATRWLGIIFFIYGVIFAVGLFLGVNYLQSWISEVAFKEGFPMTIQNWILPLPAEFASPWQILSIGLAVAGVLLIVVSFVYPRLRQTSSLD